MTAPASRRLSVLHLEDDTNDVALVAAELEQSGVECVIEAVRTRETFVAALGHECDIILSDYSLPGFDGLAALAIATKARPETPFLLVSGTLGEDLAIRALRIGATDYVIKTRLSR
jgi:DNA-binding response OmpR family regulator